MKDQVSLRIRIAWGRRRVADNEPAPPLPTLTEPPVDGEFGHNSHTSFPYYYVYQTQEESLEKATLRNKDQPEAVPYHPADDRAKNK